MANGWWAGANNAVWTTLSNWRNSETSGTQPASIPGTASSDIAYFQNNGIGGQSRTIYLNTASRSLAQINVNVQARTTVLAGGASGAPAAQTINLGASGIDLSTGTFATLTFDSNARIALTSSQIWNTGPSGTGVTVQSIISGSGFGITKQGASTLTLSAINTYTGGTTVTGGTLVLNNGSSGDGCVRGSLSATNATIRMDQVWTFGASGNIVTTLTMTNSTLNFNKSGGIGNAYMTWSGTSYTFNDSTFIGLAGTEIYPENGASIVSTGTSSFSSDLTFRLNQASTTINVSSGTFTVASVLGENGTLKGITKSGAGTLALTGANTFTGGFTLSAGTVNLGVAQVGTTSGPLGASGTITLGGGTLQYSAANQHDYSSRFSTAASQQYRCDTNGQNVTWASNLTSSGGTLVKSGTGTLTLTSASNTYSGATTILAGTLEISGAGRLGSGTYAANISNGGTLAIATSATQTLSGVISGFLGIITKSGSGALTLSNISNFYTGGTTLSEGTLNIGADGALGTGTLTLNGGTIASSGAQRTISNAMMIEDSIAVDVGSLSLFQQTGAVTLAAPPTITTFGTASASTLRGFYISGTVSGAVYTLTKAGDGSLIFSGTTDLTDIDITAGWVVFNNTNADAGTPAIDVSSGARFVLGDALVGATTTIGYLTGSGTVSPTWGASTGTRTLSVESGTFSGVLATGASGQVLALTKTAAGALTLSGTNTYTGGTTVWSGTLKAGNTAALGTGAVGVVSGANLQALASINGKLNIGGNLTNSGGTLRIGGS